MSKLDLRYCFGQGGVAWWPAAPKYARDPIISNTWLSTVVSSVLTQVVSLRWVTYYHKPKKPPMQPLVTLATICQANFCTASSSSVLSSFVFSAAPGLYQSTKILVNCACPLVAPQSKSERFHENLKHFDTHLDSFKICYIKFKSAGANKSLKWGENDSLSL